MRDPVQAGTPPAHRPGDLPPSSRAAALEIDALEAILPPVLAPGRLAPPPVSGRCSMARDSVVRWG
jgi:hypothetical protein